jgi:hypothetical protein
MEIELDYVMRLLNSEDNTEMTIPPGAGLHAW